MSAPPLHVTLREARTRRGWSQAEVAERAGISRAAVSAIETERTVPSTAAALALAAAFQCRVEDLFRLPERGSPVPEWAWLPAGERRFWTAEVAGRLLRFPVETTAAGILPHDGIVAAESAPCLRAADPLRTLVLAGCDPAAAILGSLLARAADVRLLPLVRSSRRALELLRDGRAHVAGLHLGEDPADNRRLVREMLGPGYRLVHLARWTDGVAVAPGLGVRSAAALAGAGLRWVGREEGSGARLCLDEVLGDVAAPEHLASDHRGVVEAIRSGWAQAGVCVQLVAEQARLDFLPVRGEAYDLCFPAALEEDPRLRALLDTVRSQHFRGLLADLPGYDARRAGDLL